MNYRQIHICDLVQQVTIINPVHSGFSMLIITPWPNCNTTIYDSSHLTINNGRLIKFTSRRGTFQLSKEGSETWAASLVLTGMLLRDLECCWCSRRTREGQDRVCVLWHDEPADLLLLGHRRTAGHTLGRLRAAAGVHSPGRDRGIVWCLQMKVWGLT